MSESLNDLERQRRDSLDELIRLGYDPYPAALFPINTDALKIKNEFDKEKGNFQEVSIAGRIMTRRIMGNASFAVIQDATERLQIYIRRDDICPNEDKTLYNTVFKKLLDIGDIIGVTGYMFITQTGEATLHVPR